MIVETAAYAGSQLTIALVSLLGLATMLGLGVLGRSSRGPVLWSFAFLASMCVASTNVVATETLSPVLAWGTAGLSLLVPGLMWSGFRARRGAPSHWGWLVFGAAVATLILTLLFVFASPDSKLLLFLLVLTNHVIWCLLLLLEWSKSPERREPILRPFMYANVALPVLALCALVVWMLDLAAPSGPFLSLPKISTAFSAIFLITATISLAGLSAPRLRTEANEGGRTDDFESRAQRHLSSAQSRNEQGWSLLVFRVDDAAALQAAGGTGVARTAGDLLEQCARRNFPSWSDIDRKDAFTVRVLSPGTLATVRSCVVHTLETMSGADPRTGLSVKLSASAGWVSVESAGYVFEDLLAIAEECLEIAEEAGGSRWERR